MYKVVKAKNVNLADTVYVIQETKVQPRPKAAAAPEDEQMQEDTHDGAVQTVAEYEPLLDEMDRRREIIEDAKQQAEMILRDAARRAQEDYTATMQHAQDEANQLRQNALEDGLTNGARSQVQMVGNCVAQVELAVSKLEGQQAGFMAEYEQNLKMLALEIASTILHKKVEADPAEMAELVKTAVGAVNGAKWVTVEIASEMSTLLATLTQTLQTAERSGKLEIRPIAAAFGTCRLDTPDGVVDASLYTQIENLREYFATEPTT